jgi:putative SOS response-associated peptidase YedK
METCGPKEKQPYAFALKDGGRMATAGLYENWRSPVGQNVPNATIITCVPNAMMAEAAPPDAGNSAAQTWPAWLGEDAAEREQLKAVLRPYPAEDLTCWAVSARVGNVSNNDPKLGRTG